jgi:hypothetical protein
MSAVSREIIENLTGSVYCHPAWRPNQRKAVAVQLVTGTGVIYPESDIIIAAHHLYPAPPNCHNVQECGNKNRT